MAAKSYSHATISSRFDANRAGRDFEVGDIHGMFTAFESLLSKVEFDPSADRVFALGDRVDRGPESTRALEFLALRGLPH